MDRFQINKKLFFWYTILWIFLFIALYLSYAVYFADTSSTKSKWVALFAGAIAILASACKIIEIHYNSSKNPLFDKVAKYFLNGSLIFINKTFKISAFIVLVLFCFFIKPMGMQFAGCFALGALVCYLLLNAVNYITIKTVTRSSLYYQDSLLNAKKQLYNSAIASALVSCSFVLIPVSILFHIFKDYQTINGFVLGLAIMSLIYGVSTATSKRACQCVQDAVCGFVAPIDQKDRRNPLLLIEGLTKSVLRSNFIACDLSVSYCAILFASMALGDNLLLIMGQFFPLILAGTGLFATIIPFLLISPEKNKNSIFAFFGAMLISNIIFIGISFFLIRAWMPQYIGLIGSVVVGSLGGLLACFLYANLTFSRFKPVSDVASSAFSGFCSALFQSLKEGFGKTFVPMVFIGLCIVLAFIIPSGVENPSVGLYGILIAILSLVSSAGAVIGINSYLMNEKASDIVLESYEEDLYNVSYKEELKTPQDMFLSDLSLNYTNVSSILVCVGVLIAYSIFACLEEIDIFNPYVIFSIFVGASIPFVYCARALSIVSMTAKRLGIEVKRQFRKMPQILNYEIRPNYEKCIDVSSLNSTIHTIISTILVLIPFGFITKLLKTEALGGFVLGVIISSSLLLFAISGSSLVVKNAKKYFEQQFNCSQNVEEYGAINISETAFLAFRELVIPAINSLVKFIAICAMVLAPMFLI